VFLDLIFCFFQAQYRHHGRGKLADFFFHVPSSNFIFFSLRFCGIGKSDPPALGREELQSSIFLSFFVHGRSKKGLAAAHNNGD